MTRPESSEKPPQRRRPRAKTPEDRERQLIAASVDLAEEQIRTGRVSAQVLTHYLKLGTERERLERQRLIQENELLKAKVDAMASSARTEELFEEVIKAMKVYTGQEADDADDY